MPEVAKPILTRPERIGAAARRAGFPTPDLMRAEIESGALPIPTAKFGKRGLLHVDGAALDMWLTARSIGGTR